jgi:hypothetical protein
MRFVVGDVGRNKVGDGEEEETVEGGRAEGGIGEEEVVDEDEKLLNWKCRVN